MKRIWMLPLWLGGLMVLIACGAQARVDTAAAYLRALNERDVEAAATYACEERAQEIADSLMAAPVPDSSQATTFSFINISCAAAGGDDVSCRYTIQQQLEDDLDTPEQYVREVVFHFEDGEICGFEEQVAQ
jgi:hypothetical protein